MYRAIILALLAAGFTPAIIGLFLFDHLHTKSEHRLLLIVVILESRGLAVAASGSFAYEKWAQVVSAVALAGVTALILVQFRSCWKLYRAHRQARRVLRPERRNSWTGAR